MTADRDGPLGITAIAAFVVLVAAMLGAVRGWRAPFVAWLVLAVVVLAGLALQALVIALAAAWRRDWRPAAGAGLLAAALVAAIAAIPALGLRTTGADGADPFGDRIAARAAAAARSAR